MKNYRINLLSTGGTIEKSYIEQRGEFFNQEPIISEIINRKLRLPFTQILHHKILFKDSLHFNDQDRNVILEKLKELDQERDPIVVLHGTDTMKNSIQYLEGKIKLNVPVVFTGAMRPIGLIDSDAFQNIVEAFALSRVLKSGFYMSFHGHLFYGSKFYKDMKNSIFIAE